MTHLLLKHRKQRLTAAAIGLLCVAPTARADVAMAWGRNNYGQLGDGNNFNSSSPVTVIGLSSDVSAVAAGGEHSLAIQNGAALAWGYNSYGQLGNASNTSSYSPVVVNGLSSGVTAIAAGSIQSLAIQNGTAKAWGSNAYGQLGIGSYNASNVPITVTGLNSGVSAIASGAFHSLAIQNGAALAWGYNGNGQLVNGSNKSSNVPVTVTGLSSGVTAIAAGGYFNLAIQNGAAFAWGENAEGALGDGPGPYGYAADSSIPVPVTGLSSGVTAIAAGDIHSLAIKNGNVYAWGDNDFNQLGDGGSQNSLVPELVLDTPADIIAIAAGEDSSYALSSDGSLWVWGDDGFGELGLPPPNTPGKAFSAPQHLPPPTGYIFTGISSNSEGFHAVATLAAVPEPASSTLLALGAATLLTRRKNNTTHPTK